MSKRKSRCVVVTWAGADLTASDDQAATDDPVIYMSGAEYVTVQLKTPTVAAGVATFDLHTIGSNHEDAGYTTAHFQADVFSAQAENVVSSPVALTQGPHFLKLRLDVNTAAPTTGEDVTAYVWIDYWE
jgi:hypothetical protein